MASLCHPWFTTTNLSYRFPIFETSATALCGTTGMLRFCSCLETKHVQLILAMFRPQREGAPVHHRKVDDTHVEVNQRTSPGLFRHVATSQSERKKRLKPLKSHKKHCDYEPNLWYNLHFAVSPLTYSDVGHIWPHTTSTPFLWQTVLALPKEGAFCHKAVCHAAPFPSHLAGASMKIIKTPKKIFQMLCT